MVYFMNLKKKIQKKFQNIFFQKKKIQKKIQNFFKFVFFSIFFQNLFVKYFFLTFGKNFKSLAPKMAEIFLNQKKKFGQKNFKSPALFFVIRYIKSKNSGCILNISTF